MKERQQLLHEFGNAVLTGCTVPVGVKYALEVQGCPVGDTRRPIGYLSDAKKNEIITSMKKYHEFVSI